MSTTKGGSNVKPTSIVGRTVRRIQEIWSELAYADRRLFEIRTGIDVDGFQRRNRINELEALYAADQAASRAKLAPHGR
jgi:hypothetical protein